MGDTLSSHHPPCFRFLPRSLTRIAAGTDGTAAIEFSIIAPLLILMLIGTVDLGIGTYQNMQVQNAAQAGAEYAMARGFNTAAISSAVTNATALQGISVSPAPSQFCGCPSETGIATAVCNSVCPSGAASGTYVTVFAQLTYTTLLPYPLLPPSYTFVGQSTVRTQ
jgi:Flp pilus assembly protein TadG